MYFLVIETRPDPSGPDFGSVGGAFASCWADTNDPDEAERRARSLLEEYGWRAGMADERYPVERTRYEGNSKSLARFDQAIADGVAITLHTWPVGAEH